MADFVSCRQIWCISRAFTKKPRLHILQDRSNVPGDDGQLVCRIRSGSTSGIPVSHAGLGT